MHVSEFLHVSEFFVILRAVIPRRRRVRWGKRRGLETMQPAEVERLSRIATMWSDVLQAHGSTADTAEAARNRLLLRYSSSVYRYLLGALRDPDEASDLCQEFAVRFLRGDFRKANPQRGRFRDYVKSALSNLVNDHFRAQQARPRNMAANFEPAAAEEPSLSPEQEFLSSWRQTLLDQTWKALAKANPTYHAVLRLRIDNPDMQSPEMAARLTEQLGKPMSPDNIRKSLERSHGKFADLLIDQVAESLEGTSKGELQAELETLDLLKYCKSAFEKRPPN
jgi:RNA polymerase sigma factor (sigma-70 family)